MIIYKQHSYSVMYDKHKNSCYVEGKSPPREAFFIMNTFNNQLRKGVKINEIYVREDDDAISIELIGVQNCKLIVDTSNDVYVLKDGHYKKLNLSLQSIQKLIDYSEELSEDCEVQKELKVDK